jgi:peptidoglycan/LPS O-acetylase OafA/YrhL
MIESRFFVWDWVRLFCAMAVIYSHSFSLFKANGTDDLIRVWTGEFTNSGEVSVWIFFVISGFLVTRSGVTSSSFRNFILKRIARIYPALIVCNMFTVLVIFFLVPESNKFSMLRYFSINSISLTNLFELEGVFNTNLVNAINGPLWTLANEIRLYIAVCLVLLLKNFFNMISNFKVIYVSLVILLVAAPNLVPAIGGHILGGHNGFITNSLSFFLGGLGYLFRLHKINFAALFSVFLGALFVFVLTELRLFILLAVLSLLMLVTKISYFSSRPLFGDYSYSLYLYGWFCAQLVHLRWPGLSPLESLPPTFLFSFTLAILSWHFLEKPFIAFMRRKIRE